MSSGWSQRATQRSTSASSRSSISSKWRFATPSLLKGHSLSEGWSSGEAEGRNSRCTPSGTSTSPPVCHPALSSTKRMRLLVAAPTCLAKCSRANEITRVDLNQRPFSYRTPHFADDRLEAQALLVFTPQLYLRRRVFLLEPHNPHRELFLKASC